MIKEIFVLRKNISVLCASDFYHNDWHIHEKLFLLFVLVNGINFVINFPKHDSFILILTCAIVLVSDLLFLRTFYKITCNYFDLSARTVKTISHIKENHQYIGDFIDRNSLPNSVEQTLNHLDTMLQQEYSVKLLQKQAEFESIVSQINPHFLFNTLDSIRGNAVLENAPKSAEMIELLSRIFRYTISHRSVITLEQEINNSIDYIKLQQLRFEKQLTFKKEINCERDLLLTYQVPKLTLQPIVENAIIHGLTMIRESASIKLKILTTQSRIIISIIDNGCGMDLEKLNSLNKSLSSNYINTNDMRIDKGVGLSNVNSRIKMLFGNEYGITVFSSIGNGSEFQITLPLETVQDGYLNISNK